MGSFADSLRRIAAYGTAQDTSATNFSRRGIRLHASAQFDVPYRGRDVTVFLATPFYRFVVSVPDAGATLAEFKQIQQHLHHMSGDYPAWTDVQLMPDDEDGDIRRYLDVNKLTNASLVVGDARLQAPPIRITYETEAYQGPTLSMVAPYEAFERILSLLPSEPEIKDTVIYKGEDGSDLCAFSLRTELIHVGDFATLAENLGNAFSAAYVLTHLGVHSYFREAQLVERPPVYTVHVSDVFDVSQYYNANPEGTLLKVECTGNDAELVEAFLDSALKRERRRARASPAGQKQE